MEALTASHSSEAARRPRCRSRRGSPRRPGLGPGHNLRQRSRPAKSVTRAAASPRAHQLQSDLSQAACSGDANPVGEGAAGNRRSGANASTPTNASATGTAIAPASSFHRVRLTLAAAAIANTDQAPSSATSDSHGKCAVAGSLIRSAEAVSASCSQAERPSIGSASITDITVDSQAGAGSAVARS